MRDRDGSRLDAVLNLLDRQVLDVDGLMVCKVDDVELAQANDGALTVTAILSGPAALWPRFSGRIGRSLLELWQRLGIEQRDRAVPWRIDFTLVERVSTAVHLSCPREGVLSKNPEVSARSHRLDHLLGMTVHSNGRTLGRVLDVRLTIAAVGTEESVLNCTDLIVGRARPGAMLGYDRGGDRGPLLLRELIRWWHRHTGQVPLRELVGIDWDAGTVEVRDGMDRLTHA